MYTSDQKTSISDKSNHHICYWRERRTLRIAKKERCARLTISSFVFLTSFRLMSISVACIWRNLDIGCRNMMVADGKAALFPYNMQTCEWAILRYTWVSLESCTFRSRVFPKALQSILSSVFLMKTQKEWMQPVIEKGSCTALNVNHGTRLTAHTEND